MVHIPGPVTSTARELRQALEQLLRQYPNATPEELRRLSPVLQGIHEDAVREQLVELRRQAGRRPGQLTSLG